MNSRPSNGSHGRSKPIGERGGMNPSYHDWRKEELLRRAREIGIKGRSAMTKEQLIRALCKSQEETVHELLIPDGDRDRIDGLAGSNGDVHAGRAAAVAAREVTPGALREQYEIPDVTFRRKEAR